MVFLLIRPQLHLSAIIPETGRIETEAESVAEVFFVPFGTGFGEECFFFPSWKGEEGRVCVEGG